MKVSGRDSFPDLEDLFVFVFLLCFCVFWKKRRKSS